MLSVKHLEDDMAPPKAVFPKYSEDDAHVIRRLGAAVVAQWDALPKAVRELLVEQATFTHDRHQTVQLKQTIEIFVEKHAGWKSDDA
jgi:hypothetical protein